MSPKYDYSRWAKSRLLVLVTNWLFWIGVIITISVPPFLLGTQWEDYILFAALPAILLSAVQKQVRWHHWVCPVCRVQLPISKNPRRLRNCPRCQVKLYKEPHRNRKSP